MNVKLTPRALSEAEAKKRWWRKNRQASPDLFDDELAGALQAILRDPHIGTIHPSKHHPAPRTNNLGATQPVRPPNANETRARPAKMKERRDVFMMFLFSSEWAGPSPSRDQRT